jgi:hypothetical protein
MKPSHFSRRNFLTGLGGVTVGLPFIEALAPRKAFAAGAPKRFMIFFQCAGIKREKFYPTNMGALTSASFGGTSLEPLAPYAGKILIPRGINNAPDGSDGHAQRPITSTTCSPSNGSATGISIDQAIAQHVKGKALPTHCGAFERSQRGNCSWLPGRAAETFSNPYQVYKQLVNLPLATGTGTKPADAAQVLERLTKRRQSALDLVKGRMDELKRMSLAKSDTERLDQYFSAIRDIEIKMAGSGMMPGPTTPSMPLSAAKEAEIKSLENAGGATGDGQIPKTSYLHLELIALAWASNYAQTASIMYGTVGTGSTWNFEGVMTDRQQHAISHREGPDPEGRLAQIDNWHAKHFRFLLDKLSAYTEQGGTILDNSAIVWTNEIEHGVGHNINNMPYVIAGGLGGYLKTGQMLPVKSGTRNANLWVTMLQGFGSTANSFGVGAGAASGNVPEIVA